MKNKRRDFLKYSGLAGLGMAGGMMKGLAADKTMEHLPEEVLGQAGSEDFADDQLTMIGLYGPWAASLTANKLPSLSFRNPERTDIESWRPMARQRVMDRMAIPDIGGLPEVRVTREFVYDGLLITGIGMAIALWPTHGSNTSQTRKCKNASSRHTCFS